MWDKFWGKSASTGTTDKIINIIGKTLAVMVSVGFIAVLSNEGFQVVRGWRNTEGTFVEGFGVWERNMDAYYTDRFLSDSIARRSELKAKLLKEFPTINAKAHEWELLDFYRFEWECQFMSSRNQQEWLNDRKQWARMEDAAQIYNKQTIAELKRYKCAPMRMYYQPGMGWSLY